LGTIGVPALFILGFGILSPLALAELMKPARYRLPMNTGDFWLYLVLSLVFLILAGTNFAFLRKPIQEQTGNRHG
jgi:Sec-independent protein secretion pathway component TatC